MQPQTETQTWQVDGAQLRYIHAMLTQAGMAPQWQAAGRGSYVLVLVVPVGFDLPTFLDGQHGAPRRRPWWQHINTNRTILIVSIITLLILLPQGLPALMAELAPAALPAGIDPPAIADPLAGVRDQVDVAVTGLALVAQLAGVLVALLVVVVFRRPLAAAGGALWKAGGMLARKAGKDA